VRGRRDIGVNVQESKRGVTHATEFDAHAETAKVRRKIRFSWARKVYKKNQRRGGGDGKPAITQKKITRGVDVVGSGKGTKKHTRRGEKNKDEKEARKGRGERKNEDQSHFSLGVGEKKE